MKVRRLRKVLEGLAKLYEEAGDSAKGKGLRTLANLLREKDQLETRALFAEIDRARSRSA